MNQTRALFISLVSEVRDMFSFIEFLMSSVYSVEMESVASTPITAPGFFSKPLKRDY